MTMQAFSQIRKLPFILVVGALLRIVFYLVSDNNGGDALARAATIQQWMNHPTFFPNSPQWGPIYFWISGTLGLLVGAEVSGRLLSLVLGTLTIFVGYFLSGRVWNFSTASYTALVLALSGLLIGYSTTSSSEEPYLFFLLIALWSYFEYRVSGKLWPLAVGGFCLSVSAGIRYEAWLFVPILLILLSGWHRNLFSLSYWRSRHGAAIAVFGLLASAWPLLWAFVSWRHYGDPLYGVHYAAADVKNQLLAFPRSPFYMAILPIGVSAFALSPIPAAGLLFAANAPTRLARQFWFITFAFLLVQEIQIWRHATIALARYSLTLVVLCSVLCAGGLERMAQGLARRSNRPFALWVMISLVASLAFLVIGSELRNPLSDKIASMSPRLRYALTIRDLVKGARPYIQPKDGIIIDDYHWDGNIIQHALGYPFASGRVFLAATNNLSKLATFIQHERPRFLICTVQGTLCSAINIELPDSPGRFGLSIRATRILSSSTYYLYQLSYGND